MEKGALLISVVSLIGLTTCILPFCLVSTLLIHVALKSPQALRQHMRLFVRYTFLKLSTKALTSLWIEMRRLVKAFATSKLKDRHIQRPTPNFRPQDPPPCAYIGDPCTYATSTLTHIRVNAFLFLNVAMQYCKAKSNTFKIHGPTVP